MNCDDVRELAGAYALEALSPDERREVNAHLAECNLHEEFAALRATASLLAYAAEEREPTFELRSRIMAAIGAPDGALASIPAPMAPPTPAPIPFRPRRRSRGFSYSAALAAAFAAIAFGMFVWNMSLLREPEPTGASGPSFEAPRAQNVAITRVVATGPAQGTMLSYIDDQQLSVLEVVGLTPLQPGRIYEIWTLRGKVVTGVTTFVVAADGTARIGFASALADGDTVAVTEEPAGGSLAPTTEPIFALQI